MESNSHEYMNSGCVDCNEGVNNEPFISFVWYITLSCVCFIVVVVLMVIGRAIQIGQKTRNSQQRRPYNTRQRQSVSQPEPTIYVSPANFPPPPKYEAMAPPSYDEVVGIHYPNYQVPVQPITQPITSALAQSSNSSETTVTNNESTNNVTGNVTRNDTNMPSTVLTVTNERATATASS